MLRSSSFLSSDATLSPFSTVLVQPSHGHCLISTTRAGSGRTPSPRQLATFSPTLPGKSYARLCCRLRCLPAMAHRALALANHALPFVDGYDVNGIVPPSASPF